jgi:hypothetical protein
MGWLVHPKTYKNEGGQYVFYRKALDGSKYDSDSFDIGNRDAWRRELERYHRSPEGLKLGELASMRGLVVAYEVYGFGRVGGTNKLRHALFPQVFYDGTEKHFFRKYGILSVYDRKVRGTKRVSFE